MREIFIAILIFHASVSFCFGTGSIAGGQDQDTSTTASPQFTNITITSTVSTATLAHPTPGTDIAVSESLDLAAGKSIKLNGSAQQDVSSGASPTLTGTNFTGIPAAGITSTPTGNIAATDVDSAIAELEGDKVSGPASVSDNTLVAFDGTTGKLVKQATDFNVSSIDLGNGSLLMPVSATPSTSTAGQISLDSSITDHQPLFQYYDGAKNLSILSVDTAELPATDNEIVVYDAGTDKFIFEARVPGADGEIPYNNGGTEWGSFGFYDDATGYVGIGQSAPATILHTKSDTSGKMILEQYETSDNPGFLGRKANGSSASPSTALSGDILFQITAQGLAVTTPTWKAGGQIQFETTENWSATAAGTSIKFKTTDNGTLVNDVRMVIDQNGFVGVNTLLPDTELHIKGGLCVDTDDACTDPGDGNADIAGNVAVGGDVTISGALSTKAEEVIDATSPALTSIEQACTVLNNNGASGATTTDLEDAVAGECFVYVLGASQNVTIRPFGDAQCTASTVPRSCCTGSGTGTCVEDIMYLSGTAAAAGEAIVNTTTPTISDDIFCYAFTTGSVVSWNCKPGNGDWAEATP